jgi:hypothetical protein
MLGDAGAAVSLFNEVQQDAKTAVKQGCMDLIRRGDESRVPEMADLLGTYGDKELANAYLNSGHPDLESAARRWAQRHEYHIGTGPGSRLAIGESGT